MLEIIPATIRRQVWSLVRPYIRDSQGNPTRLRARDIPGIPFFVKPVAQNWTVRLDHGMEWIFGPDVG